MILKTGRAEGSATVTIDYERCNGCGACVRACKGQPLYMAGGRVQIDQTRYFGCIGCGHCMASCPSGAIRVTGRDISPADVISLPGPTERSSYAQLQALLRARRSVRDFQDREVPAELIAQILAAAQTAPMGLPPSEVGVLVLAGKDKVRAFRNDAWRVLRSWTPVLRPPLVYLMRLRMGREEWEMFRGFVAAAVAAYEEKDREGVDWFFYEAPLAMCFYASAYAEPADPIIAATYAMLAAEASGLGTCMLGFPGYALQHDARLKAKYGMPAKIQPGVTVIFGYPGPHFHHALTRRFASVHYA